MPSAPRQVIACVLLLASTTCVSPPPEAASREPSPPAEPTATTDFDVTTSAPSATPIADRYREIAARILRAVRDDSRAYEKLTYLCDRIGNRLSGSKSLDEAVRWTAATFQADGMESRLEPVTVPVWVRGRESAAMVEPRSRKLHMLGLGNSVGTPAGGLTAEVVCVRGFDDLDALGATVKGKIVLYTARMPAFDPAKGAGYGDTVIYRVTGPSRAAAAGAVAAFVRSVTARSIQSPHTGTLHYDAHMPKIPAAALSTEDADFIARRCAEGERVVVRLEMEAHFAPDAQSANVIGEIRGSTLPDEVVVVGGHLDSWDVGQGAHDDGGPSMAVMEAMRILVRLGLVPRRTIRAVLFVNEENGLAGGRGYAARHKAEMKDHVAAIEADSGAFRPLGFTSPRGTTEHEKRANARLADVVSLLAPIGAARRKDGGGGADIGPMAEFGVPQIGLDVDASSYFDYHHTEADTLDKVSKDDLDLCVAALATTVYVLADMEERLRD